MDTTDSGARAGVVGSGTGSGATLSRVGTTVFQKGTAPCKTHEHAIAVAASGALPGGSLLGGSIPAPHRLAVDGGGRLSGGLGLLRAARSTLSEREKDRPESGAT